MKPIEYVSVARSAVSNSKLRYGMLKGTSRSSSCISAPSDCAFSFFRSSSVCNESIRWGGGVERREGEQVFECVCLSTCISAPSDCAFSFFRSSSLCNESIRWGEGVERREGQQGV
jgi:hypothetical protein